MKYKIKEEELLNYLKNKNYKENKTRTDINIKNNNILKNITLPKTINCLNIESFKNNFIPPNINNYLYLKEKDNNKIDNINKDTENKNKNKSPPSSKVSKVLILKKINYDKNFFKLFKKKNSINIDVIKKYLNIKKKKYNKGNDFCSFFLKERSDYYLNTLNQGLINSFISFYSNADKLPLYDNIEKENNNLINNNQLKIYNTKYPIFNVKKMNNDNYAFNFIKTSSNKNELYEKCRDILGTLDKSVNKSDNNYFFKGLNHDIKYDLENYISDKMKLLEINEDNNILFENSNFINKYPFQFIKIQNNKNMTIDPKNIITDKKLKYSFDKPRIMYPLFLNSLFDNKNIFNHCSLYKNHNIKNINNNNLNLIFSKNIDRFHDLNTHQFSHDFQNSEDSFNILNGKYLMNPFQTSINNKDLIQKTNIVFKPKKLITKFETIFDEKTRKKYKQKRSYLDLINDNSKNKNIIKNEEKKLVIINKKNIGKLLNNSKDYIMVDNIQEGFDFLFDFDICGKMFYTSEFMDEFEYNGYNTLIDLINKNYLYFSVFYIFVIDDEQLKKGEDYSVSKIVNTIRQIINDKFGFIINNNNYQLKVNIKNISNPHLIYYEINNIYDELVTNNFNNLFSVYNTNIYTKILNNIKTNDNISNDNNQEIIKMNINTNYNRYENYILNMIKDDKLKNEIKIMINNKYSKRNIL